MIRREEKNNSGLNRYNNLTLIIMVTMKFGLGLEVTRGH